MKIKSLFILLILLAAGGSAFAQGFRFDATITSQGTIAGVSNAVIIPASPQVALCNFPANAVPCTNKATTYTSQTLATPCATSTQIVLTGTSSCVASPDAQDNWGVWVPAGIYSYTVTIAGVNQGPYTITLFPPSGNYTVGNLTVSGTATLNGTNNASNLNNILWVGPSGYATIAAAVAAAPTSRVIIAIQSTYAGTECPAAVSSNISYWDFRGGNIICTQDVVTMKSIDAAGIDAMQRAVHLIKAKTLLSTGSPVSYYDETYMDNVNFNGAQADGGSSDMAFFGANSGTLTRASGNELNVILQGTASGNPSTGGTITEAVGAHGYVTTLAGSTTAINIATGYEAIGCATIQGSIPVSCYGLFARAQTTGTGGKGSSRNYSVATEGVNIAMYDANAVGGARSGWDFENSSHNAFPVLFNDSANSLILRSTNGVNGILFQDSNANNLLQIAPATVAIFGAGTSFFPATVNSVDVGITSNPFRNLLLGTAATNLFKFQPSATAGARVVNLWDFGANGPSTQNYPGLTILTSQYTNSTTGFTNVAGGNTLQFPVLASTTYTATCHLYYQAAATGGLNIEFTGPAAPTTVTYGLNLPVSATTQAGNGVATAYGTSLGAVATTNAANFDAIVSFSLINGVNAGTVNLLAKSSAAVQLQIQAGSFCRIQ